MIIYDKEENAQIECCFIGSVHDFSDQSLTVARNEFETVSFSRASSLDSLLSGACERPDLLRLAVFNQVTARPLLESLALLRKTFPNAMAVVAYRQPAAAIDILGSTGVCLSQCPIGFLPMNYDLDRWLIVLKLLLFGEKYIPAELLALQGTVSVEAPQAPADSDDDPSGSCLTDREMQVLSCVALGKQNKLIAERLGVSEHTIKLHVHHVIAKLGVNNRTEAAVWYLAHQRDGRHVQ